MIDTEQIDALAAQLQPGDLVGAVKIYEKIAYRQISTSILQKFIRRRHPFTGRRPGSHQPIDMYRAIAQAVAQRCRHEQETTRKAAELVMQIIHDTTPRTPIAQ